MDRVGIGRIAFADQLRGIAALLVVASHYAGTYWYARDLAATLTFSPVQPGPVPWLAAAVVGLPFNPGAVGVATFFMISGFVIPFSFRHHGTASFLAARCLRIFPAYLAALAVGLLARYLSARYWGQPFGISRGMLLTNALLINDLVGDYSIDMVNWTLAIELKFYLLYAFARRMIARRPAGCVLAVGVAAIAVNVVAVALMPLVRAWQARALESMATEAMYLAFMLLGVLFHLHLQRLLPTARFAVLSALMLALFVVCWAVGPSSAKVATDAAAYGWGWLVFALCFVARRGFPAVAPLHWLAAISYPLYLAHSMIGYAAMKVLIVGHGASYVEALAAAIGLSLLVAWLIHATVERRCIAWGRAIGGAARPRPQRAEAAG